MYAHKYVYNQRGNVMFQSLELLPLKQSLKNQGFQKYLLFSADLLTLKVNICSQRQFKRTGFCSSIPYYNQLHIAIHFVGYPSLI